jgi:hypothetical protein
MATKMKMVTKMKMGGVKKKLTKKGEGGRTMGPITTPENKYNPSDEATQNNGPMVPPTGSKGDVSKPPGSTKNFKKGGLVKLKKAMYGTTMQSNMMKKSGTSKKK